MVIGGAAVPVKDGAGTTALLTAIELATIAEDDAAGADAGKDDTAGSDATEDAAAGADTASLAKRRAQRQEDILIMSIPGEAGEEREAEIGSLAGGEFICP